MKFTTIVSGLAITLASVSEVAAVVIPPTCAFTCFNTVMQNPAAKTCTEANMFLCMCKVPTLTQAYRNCACTTCTTTADKNAAIKFGKDTCVQYGAPVTIPDTCSA